MGKCTSNLDWTGTDVKLAPTYACTGMVKFESLVFNENQDLLDLIKLWKRYIDDVFALFKGSESQLDELVGWLNTLMPGTVKFTSNYSAEKIEFLDIEVSIEGGKLETNLYIKPTNLQLYLDFFSNHPAHCKKGIVYSQALRIIERCSKPADVDSHLANLNEKLAQRNYPQQLIQENFDKAKQKNRKK